MASLTDKYLRENSLLQTIETNNSVGISTLNSKVVKNKALLSLVAITMATNSFANDINDPNFVLDIQNPDQTVVQQIVEKPQFSPEEVLGQSIEAVSDSLNYDSDGVDPTEIMTLANELAQMEGTVPSELFRELQVMEDLGFDFENYKHSGKDGVDPTELYSLIKNGADKEGVSASEFLKELEQVAKFEEYSPKMSYENDGINPEPYLEFAQNLAQSQNIERSDFIGSVKEKVELSQELNSGEQQLFDMVQEISIKEGIEPTDLLRELSVVAEQQDFQPNMSYENDGINPEPYLEFAQSLAQSQNIERSDFIDSMKEKVELSQELNSGEQQLFDMVQEIAIKEGIEPTELLRELSVVAEQQDFQPKMSYETDGIDPKPIMEAANKLANENEMDTNDLFLDIKNKVDNGLKLTQPENDIFDLVKEASELEGAEPSELLNELSIIAEFQNFTPKLSPENVLKMETPEFERPEGLSISDGGENRYILEMAGEIAFKQGQSPSELFKELNSEFNPFDNDGIDKGKLENLIHDSAMKQGIHPTELVAQLEQMAEDQNHDPRMHTSNAFEMPKSIKRDVVNSVLGLETPEQGAFNLAVNSTIEMPKLLDKQKTNPSNIPTLTPKKKKPNNRNSIG